MRGGAGCGTDCGGRKIEEKNDAIFGAGVHTADTEEPVRYREANRRKNNFNIYDLPLPPSIDHVYLILKRAILF